MAAQVNLLPSVKQDRLQAQRLRQLIVSVGVGVLIAAVAIPVLLLVIRSGQSLVLKRTQSSINDKQNKIASFPDITTILTIKDHLAALPDLYEGRLRMSGLFNLLPTVTPQEVRLNALETGADGSIRFSGTANSYAAVQKFYTALLDADVQVDPEKVEPDPNSSGHFTNLVLESVSGSSGKEVSFVISGQYSTHLISGGDDAQ